MRFAHRLHRLGRLRTLDRLRAVLDERRWQDYARSSTSIFYTAPL